MLFVPTECEYIINSLQKNGYEAYLVGGCVRDMLMGLNPHDFDITTSAPPEITLSLFEKTVPTGIKHGTVTVILNGAPFEVTTYRTDGEYKDSRHPESVCFVSSLREDLARRDFTVNALAYNRSDGLKDYFGGAEDIKKGILRAVGEPKKRFTEDALRIMRLFRFASVLDFTAEEHTLSAALAAAPTLKEISAERLYRELLKAVCGKNPGAISSLTDMGGLDFIGLTGKPDYEKISLLPQNEIRLFVFLFSGGANITALDRLKVANKTKTSAEALLKLGSMPFPKTKPGLKEMLFLTSERDFTDYLTVAAAYGRETAEAEKMLEAVIKNREPYRISDLKINGSDLLEHGICGTAVGKTLEKLRRLAVTNPTVNTKSRLLEIAKDLNSV